MFQRSNEIIVETINLNQSNNSIMYHTTHKITLNGPKTIEHFI